MSGLIDEVLVGLVLAISLVYAIFSLGPRTLRRRLLAAAAAPLLRLPGLRGLARRLQTATATAKGSCGGCGDCGSSAPAQTTSASGAAPAAEISVSVAAIGKRRRGKGAAQPD